MNLKRPMGALAFILAGAVNAVLSTLAYAPPFLETYGAAALARELLAQLAAFFLVGCGLILALRGQLSRPAQSLRRPGRFVLLVAAAAVPLSWLGANALASLRHGRPVFRLLPLPELVEGWLSILLWGCLFAWLYLLYLQRGENQLRLNTVLAERAILARQLAQAELLAARAHIDPIMVAGVLRRVQARYAEEPQRGAALLDHLVGYLRLALNRGGRHGGAAAVALQALREEAAK